MRLAATLLLFAMACIFAAASWWHDAHPALPWVQSFAEAAMVGGLADWFAVTALFRHPLGLPIPHTAIIPSNKDRIGDSLAVFLKENFLTPTVVARRLEEVDMAGAAARWLSADRPQSLGANRRGFGPLIARVIEALDQKVIGDLVRDAATEKLRALAISPIVADTIDTTLDHNRHEPLIDSAIDWGLRTLDDQESTIRGMVADRTNWLLRLVNVDTRVSGSLIAGLRKLLWEMGGDPHHPLRRRIGESLRTYAFDLRHFPETQATIEGFKTDLIANPAMGQWLAGLWDEARTGIVANLTNPSATGPGKLAEAMKALGARLGSDAPLRAAINLHLRRAAVGLVNDYGASIVRIVSDTVRGWDARTVTEKLETAVGRDLQFIRINGTLIGGLIGLTIHAIKLAL
ncbi:hypothetical protein GCM10011529_02750 [Polymorphobacter glacialis]|uniref:DUF445 domain-containing protein n=1 Tax=Sandarakinorhabdus glacialis TaxID=1614636 RepID=A0A916ZIV2_9SPHN|nr:DUF445 domain-containing protein [Polymorphobacter glacialis]GGE00029.1 hypothetical protein GCM10011529_02750 [Polymorphobacter glacialis]